MKQGPLIFIIFAIFVLWQIFIKTDSNSQNSTQYQTYSWSSYGEKGAVNSWPKSTNGNVEKISKDLLASNYYLILDGSGSMGDSSCSGNYGTKLNSAKNALDVFFEKLPQDSNLGLYVFDYYNSSERLPLKRHSNDELTKQIKAVKAGGGTPLSTSITRGVAALTAQAQKQLGYGEYNLVVITDGEANGNENPDRIVKSMLQDTPIVLHTIGFCIGEQHALNQKGYTLYRSANNPSELTSSLNAVLAEAPNFDVNDYGKNEQ